MKAKAITYGDLGDMLVRLGFVRAHTTGNHQLFKHDPSDTVVLLPPRQPSAMVDAIHLVAVRKTVVERGVVGEDEFDSALEQIESAAFARP